MSSPIDTSHLPPHVSSTIDTTTLSISTRLYNNLASYIQLLVAYLIAGAMPNFLSGLSAPDSSNPVAPLDTGLLFMFAFITRDVFRPWPYVSAVMCAILCVVCGRQAWAAGKAALAGQGAFWERGVAGAYGAWMGWMTMTEGGTAGVHFLSRR